MNVCNIAFLFVSCLLGRVLRCSVLFSSVMLLYLLKEEAHSNSGLFDISESQGGAPGRKGVFIGRLLNRIILLHLKAFHSLHS